jgi:hypothetical protein
MCEPRPSAFASAGWATMSAAYHREHRGPHHDVMRCPMWSYQREPPPAASPRPLSEGAAEVLGCLRGRTGQWVTMTELRVACGADPVGFGEPVVSAALAEIERRGITVDGEIHWVLYLRGRDPAVIEGDPPQVGESVRENVWRLA